jgi:hypothetical protein
MAEKIEQFDLDNLADVAWWIKGYLAAFGDAASTCPFEETHLNSLEKIKNNLQEELNKKEEKKL